MKGGIEACHRRHVAQDPADDVGGPQTGRLMEGRQGNESAENFFGGAVQRCRTGKVGASVHDAVADRGNRFGALGEESLERGRIERTSDGRQVLGLQQVVVGVEEAQLEAGGPCVHHQHVHGA